MWSWPVRWETAILIYTGLICNYAMRMNISIAILKVKENNKQRIKVSWQHYYDSDEQLHNGSIVASWKLFPNNLERSWQEFHPLCILLWIRHSPGLFVVKTNIIWDDFLTASTTHQLRFQVGGWLRCMELRRCLDTGLTPPFLHQSHRPLFIHFSMLVTAILGLLAPLAAYTSYYLIFAILVAQVCLISSSQF